MGFMRFAERANGLEPSTSSLGSRGNSATSEQYQRITRGETVRDDRDKRGDSPSVPFQNAPSANALATIRGMLMAIEAAADSGDLAEVKRLVQLVNREGGTDGKA